MSEVQLKEVVRLVLNSWPCYKFAISNQLGGSQTKTKDEWFCDILAEHLYKKEGTYVYELSEWIEDILNNEFDTIAEDGTLEPTARLLIQMSNWLLGRGKESPDEARQKLAENVQKLNGITTRQEDFPLPQKADCSSGESSSDEEEGS